jgi:hypothetical protein
MLLYGRGLSAPGISHVSPKSGTAGLTSATIPPEVAEALAHRTRRRPVNWKRRALGFVMFTIVLGGAAFGATYIYSDPGLQARLGVTQYINDLPWKHEELVDKLREHPLDFDRMTLALSTRSGTATSPPKASFTDTELANAQYVKWDAAFRNNLSGVDGRNDKIEARFFDPGGNQIATSDDERFIGPKETAADFSGVALIPNAAPIAPGSYKIALYSDDQLLTEQRFDVTPDLKARAEIDRAAADAAAAAHAEDQKRRQEAERLAMIEERMRRPLSLKGIEFINSTKDGTVLSGPSSVFNVSKVLFVGWRAIFDNRLYGLNNNQYRVDAAYIGPDGGTLGSVDDIQTIKQSNNRAIFSGRVGNSAGGAFLPGQYTVNFYLNGQYFAQRNFRVVADAGLPYNGGGMSSGGGASAPGPGASASAANSGIETPTLATGTIDGIGGGGTASMELRLRPQPNGFLHGELVVHMAGYGATPIEGFVRGNRLQFQVPYGGETLYFEGERDRDVLSGTFESTPSGNRGTWTTRAD